MVFVHSFSITRAKNDHVHALGETNGYNGDEETRSSSVS
jgi:hypothetical protein